MAQVFKLKRVPLSQIQEMMLLDDLEQARTWLRMRDDKDCLVSDDGLGVDLPTNPRPQGRAQVVSERILRKRNGVLQPHIHMQCSQHTLCCYTSVGPMVIARFSMCR